MLWRAVQIRGNIRNISTECKWQQNRLCTLGSDLLTKSIFGRYINDLGHVMFSQQVDTWLACLDMGLGGADGIALGHVECECGWGSGELCGMYRGVAVWQCACVLVCVCVCTCVYLRICLCICMCVYVCMDECVCITYVCMYVWIYVCMYVCMYALCVYVCTCVCMYAGMYACMYVCMYACMYVYTYVIMYVCICYVCMYLCMYVHNNVCTSLRIYVFIMYVCMYVRMKVRKVHMYLCTCVYVKYVCMCVCIYIYTYKYAVYSVTSFLHCYVNITYNIGLLYFVCFLISCFLSDEFVFISSAVFVIVQLVVVSAH